MAIIFGRSHRTIVALKGRNKLFGKQSMLGQWLLVNGAVS